MSLLKARTVYKTKTIYNVEVYGKKCNYCTFITDGTLYYIGFMS